MSKVLLISIRIWKAWNHFRLFARKSEKTAKSAIRLLFSSRRHREYTEFTENFGLCCTDGEIWRVQINITPKKTYLLILV
jgi:hypothetical protein